MHHWNIKEALQGHIRSAVMLTHQNPAQNGQSSAWFYWNEHKVFWFKFHWNLCPTNNKSQLITRSRLIHSITRTRTGDKPLPEPMVTQIWSPLRLPMSARNNWWDSQKVTSHVRYDVSFRRPMKGFSDKKNRVNIKRLLALCVGNPT